MKKLIVEQCFKYLPNLLDKAEQICDSKKDSYMPENTKIVKIHEQLPIKKSPSNNPLSFFRDDEGELSVMRLVFFLTNVVVLTFWSLACWNHGDFRFISFSNADVTLLVGNAFTKALQSRFEGSSRNQNYVEYDTSSSNVQKINGQNVTTGNPMSSQEQQRYGED